MDWRVSVDRLTLSRQGFDTLSSSYRFNAVIILSISLFIAWGEDMSSMLSIALHRNTRYLCFLSDCACFPHSSMMEIFCGLMLDLSSSVEREREIERSIISCAGCHSPVLPRWSPPMAPAEPLLLKILPVLIDVSMITDTTSSTQTVIQFLLCRLNRCSLPGTIAVFFPSKPVISLSLEFQANFCQRPDRD